MTPSGKKTDLERDWFKEQQRLYRRGFITYEELEEARLQLQRLQSRPGRVLELTSPEGAQSVRVPMDRMTELALEHLMGLGPVELDLDRKVEKAELFRIAICRWALKSGWNPPFEEEI